MELARQQEAPGDVELLVLGVARHLDDLEALLEAVRDHVERVGAEQHHGVGEIHGELEVLIHEVVATLGVEQLEQHFDDAEAALSHQAIHAVDHQHRVVDPGLVECPHDLAGPRAGLGARDPAQLAGVAGP